MPDADLRRILHEVAVCPHCGKPHVFPVLVRVLAKTPAPAPLFGGPGAASDDQPTLAFTCPTTHKMITAHVEPPPDTQIVGPAGADDGLGRPSDVPMLTAVDAAAPPANPEYDTWIRTSRETATSFCNTMLGASTGAVPVYFAVLKYLGASAGPGWAGQLRIAPPLLFLAATVVFALALRPRFGEVTPDGFAAFRLARLQQLNRMMLIGVALFAGGLLLAIAIAVAAS
jgi:hypothetical protein